MKKSYEEILNKLRELVEEQTLGGRPVSTIGEDELMREDLTLDSLDYAAVFLGCEQWLGIKVKEQGVNWAEVRTIGQLAKLLDGAQ